MSNKHFTHEAFLTHEVSIDLLDYLCPVRKKEVLRVDAFRYLLNRTCQQPTGALMKEGTPLNIEAGQLVTSVSELARVWDWHRDKVRDFVNVLAERDVLTIDMHKKFMVLSFPDLAERIFPYAPKTGNDESTASESSHGVEGEDKTIQIKSNPVTEEKDATTNNTATEVAESYTCTGSEKQENCGSYTARHGGYIQTDLFTVSNKAGTR